MDFLFSETKDSSNVTELYFSNVTAYTANAHWGNCVDKTSVCHDWMQTRNNFVVNSSSFPPILEMVMFVYFLSLETEFVCYLQRD